MHSRLSFLQINIFFFYALLMFFLVESISAHEIRPAIIDIDIKNQSPTRTFKLSIKLNLEALIAQLDTTNNSDDSENSEHYDSLRKMTAENLSQEFSQFTNFFLKNIHLIFDNEVFPLTVSSTDIPPTGDIDLARDSRIYFEGKVPEGSKTLIWKWSEKFGNAALRVNTTDNPELHSSYLLQGQASEIITFSSSNKNENSQKQEGWSSQWKTFKNYIQVGFVHIIPKGIDHILFVIGLFLLSAQLRPLLIQITTFTLAHSVTLGLGIYGIINISSSIIEPLIAASIIYIAIENIYTHQLNRWRPVIIFCFGLLHGLGFASVLAEIGLSSSYFATGLIAFNIGVELGQLTVIAVCFLLVGLWFKNKPWYRQRITIPASLIIAVIACYWLLERTGLIYAPI